MKYCQGPKCHEYKTKDRIRGSKGDKHYETRKKSTMYYLGGNACSTICERDWFVKFGEMALSHFGRIHEPKRTRRKFAHGIKIISIYMVKTTIVLLVTIISSLMIYLANAYQLLNNNTMMTT